MAELFYRVSFVGRYRGVERIVNHFDYREFPAPSSTNSPEYCQTVGEKIRDEFKAEYLDLFDADYGLQFISVVGYDEDGQKGNFPAVEIGIDNQGTKATEAHNGAATCLIVKKSLGLGVQVFETGHTPKRGHWAISPIPDNCITEAGVYDPSIGYAAAMLAFLGKVDNPVETVSPNTLYPVVLGFTWGATPGTTGDSVVAYSPVLGTSVRAKASFRRSRNNDR